MYTYKSKTNKKKNGPENSQGFFEKLGPNKIRFSVINGISNRTINSGGKIFKTDDFNNFDDLTCK